MTLDHMNETAKHVVDVLSITVVLGTIADMLPAVAALFTIIWTALRIYETKTVGRLIGRRDDEG